MISVAAELAGMHPQTLRIYEARGLITPKRSPKNTRLYSQDDVERLRRIQELTTELGMNLAGVEKVFELEEEMERMRRRMRALERQAAKIQQELSAEIDRVRRSMKRELVLYQPPSQSLIGPGVRVPIRRPGALGRLSRRPARGRARSRCGPRRRPPGRRGTRSAGRRRRRRDSRVSSPACALLFARARARVRARVPPDREVAQHARRRGGASPGSSGARRRCASIPSLRYSPERLSRSVTKTWPAPALASSGIEASQQPRLAASPVATSVPR